MTTDYLAKSWPYKIRKVLRYARLFGPRRTLAKVRGQYHLRKRYESLPALDRESRSGHVAIIGCGNFAYTTLAYYLKKNWGNVLRGAMDIDPDRAASLRERYGLAYATRDAEEIFADPRVDLVMIASNHASHASYAIRAIESGKAVHIEKPHVVSHAQLAELVDAMDRPEARVNLGFNRPISRIGGEIRRALSSETGRTTQTWFVAAHQISPDHWYFSEAEGGRVLGNLCHWTDFVYQMMEPALRYPMRIACIAGSSDESDLVATYRFGDGSVAGIIFSAKGHVFDGVKERYSAHRGDILIEMEDFQRMRMRRGSSTRRILSLFRDHGHEDSVRAAYALVRGDYKGCSPQYVWETGDVFLKTKQAMKDERELYAEPYADGKRVGGLARSTATER